MRFEKAQKHKSKLRLGLSGPSGSGKTKSGLRLAKGLGGKLAVIDTENGSASLYANEFDFDVLTLNSPYSPEQYIEAITAAEKADYDILMIDSISHEWTGSGGCLEIHDIVTRANSKGNSFNAWSSVTPRHKAFINAIIQSKLHIICTVRSKTAYEQGVRNGKKFVERIGVKPEQREGLEYEFTTFFDLSVSGNFASASKDRTGLFNAEQPLVLTEQTGEMLKKWLNQGVEMKPAEWTVSAELQKMTTKWINNAAERNAFPAAISAASSRLQGKDLEYMITQLKLAEKMLADDIPAFTDPKENEYKEEAFIEMESVNEETGEIGTNIPFA